MPYFSFFHTGEKGSPWLQYSFNSPHHRTLPDFGGVPMFSFSTVEFTR
jgi:hypothetical protein